MSYSLLILAGGPELTLPAARRLRELVAAGATVLGPVKPTGTRSFADGPEGSAEVRRIADELWGPDPLAARGEKSTGAGRLIWGYTPAEALARLGLARDFAYEAGPEGADILHAHRRTADRDLYFVANHQNKGAAFTASFRVTGRIPELWNPETGAITALANFTERDGLTRIPLALEARASTFIVFRDPALPGPTAPAPLSARLVSTLPLHQEIPGPWQVAFTPARGAPARAEFSKLISWTEHPDAGIRNFSGDATYTRDFDYTPPAAPARVWLDLGEVAILARASLNGHDLGVAWKSPFVFDVTAALRPGKNTLSIRVVNLWTNRLIADSALPESERITWASWNPYKPTDKPLPSGLLGPVLLLKTTSGTAPSP
jgi:hypothetical protein